MFVFTFKSVFKFFINFRYFFFLVGCLSEQSEMKKIIKIPIFI